MLRLEKKEEEGRGVAIKAIMNEDYAFASEIMVNLEVEKLKAKGLTEEEALNTLCEKLEKGEYEL